MQVHKDVFAVLTRHCSKVCYSEVPPGPRQPPPAQPWFVASGAAHAGQDQDLASSSFSCRPLDLKWLVGIINTH